MYKLCLGYVLACACYGIWSYIKTSLQRLTSIPFNMNYTIHDRETLNIVITGEIVTDCYCIDLDSCFTMLEEKMKIFPRSLVCGRCRQTFNRMNDWNAASRCEMCSAFTNLEFELSVTIGHILLEYVVSSKEWFISLTDSSSVVCDTIDDVKHFVKFLFDMDISIEQLAIYLNKVSIIERWWRNKTNSDKIMNYYWKNVHNWFEPNGFYAQQLFKKYNT